MSNENKIIGVYCFYSGSIVEIPVGKSDVKPTDDVIFKDEEGKEEYGIVKYLSKEPFDKEKVLSDSRILRKTTANDLQRVESFVERQKEALESCIALVKKHGLDMQVFRVGFSFDGGKIHFMFTADDRVDFRELVKDLAKVFKKQIYLRQVGSRDKAKMVGGYGKCGRSLCCSTFLNRLASINMEMVRDQGLESKGSSKLSGACGKLLCCLRYEVETYKELAKNLPEIGSGVKIKKDAASLAGKAGEVIGLDILNQKVKVFSENREVGVVGLDEISKIIKENK